MYLCVVISIVCISALCIYIFFFNDTPTTEIYTLSLHDALPIWMTPWLSTCVDLIGEPVPRMLLQSLPIPPDHLESWALSADRKSTRLTPVTVKSRMPSSA